MLLDAIATIILAGMMLIPLVNVFVGVIVGAHLVGVPGAAVGALIAIAITRAEALVSERFEWLQLSTEAVPCGVSEETVVTTIGRHASRMVRTETPRTRPPRQSVRAHRLRNVRERVRHGERACEARSSSIR
jgi:hypothetical protein